MRLAAHLVVQKVATLVHQSVAWMADRKAGMSAGNWADGSVALMAVHSAVHWAATLVCYLVAQSVAQSVDW